MEGPPLGPSGEDITWPDKVAPGGRKASSTRKIKPQTSNLCHIPSLAMSPCYVVYRSHGAVVWPLPHPSPGLVTSSRPSSRVYTPPGRQQPSGAGPSEFSGGRCVLLAGVPPIPPPFPAHWLHSLDQPRMIQSGTSGHMSHTKALLAYLCYGTRTRRL